MRQLYKTDYVLCCYYVVAMLCCASPFLVYNFLNYPSSLPRNDFRIKIRYVPIDRYTNETSSIQGHSNKFRWLPKYHPDNEPWIQSSRMFNSSSEPLKRSANFACGPRGGPAFLLVIAVKSNVANFERRFGIRKTWGSPNWDNQVYRSNGGFVKTIFFVGKTNETSVEKSMNRESDLYSDIVQGSFADAVGNSTIKSLFLMNWVMEHCANAHYLLQVEDDVFVNVPNLLDDIESHISRDDMIMGKRQGLSIPERNMREDRYVPSRVYPFPLYPEHLSGSAYLMSTDSVRRLMARCKDVPTFILADVHVTGICRQLTKLTIHNHDLFVRKVDNSLCSLFLMTTMNGLEPRDMHDIWHKIDGFKQNIQVVKSFCGDRSRHP